MLRGPAPCTHHISEVAILGIHQQHRAPAATASTRRSSARCSGAPSARPPRSEFAAFLKVWRELPHPRAVINDPENADIPQNASALMALCGSLYRLAKDVNFDAIVTYSTRLRREVGEFLVGSCVRREPALQRSPAFIRWAAARTQ